MPFWPRSEACPWSRLRLLRKQRRGLASQRPWAWTYCGAGGRWPNRGLQLGYYSQGFSILGHETNSRLFGLCIFCLFRFRPSIIFLWSSIPLDHNVKTPEYTIFCVVRIATIIASSTARSFPVLLSSYSSNSTFWRSTKPSSDLGPLLKTGCHSEH